MESCPNLEIPNVHQSRKVQLPASVIGSWYQGHVFGHYALPDEQVKKFIRLERLERFVVHGNNIQVFDQVWYPYLYGTVIDRMD